MACLCVSCLYLLYCLVKQLVKQLLVSVKPVQSLTGIHSKETMCKAARIIPLVSVTIPNSSWVFYSVFLSMTLFEMSLYRVFLYLRIMLKTLTAIISLFMSIGKQRNR